MRIRSAGTMAGITLTAALVAFTLLPAAAQDPLRSAVDTQVEAQQEAAQSQQRIDVLADEASAMLEEYRQLTRQSDSLRTYNDQLERLVRSQVEELESFERQLANVRITQQGIVPFMLRAIEVLEEFIALDVPFLMDERSLRLENLKTLMDRPDVSMPEKYRRLMEAYQIEMDYGRTIEAYSGPLAIEGQSRTVEFLRVGRVALIYLTFDAREAGYWNQQERVWKPLGEDYLQSINRGLLIARKEAPPDLIRMPVPAPEVSR